MDNRSSLTLEAGGKKGIENLAGYEGEEIGRGKVPFLLAERAHSESARLGKERVMARSGLGG